MKNAKIMEMKDNEINAFIRDKKVISISTTVQTEGYGNGSETKGYVTVVLYED